MSDRTLTGMAGSTWPRRVRLVTGSILFLYVLGHLLNLALGLWSLEVMDVARPYFMAPWQNPVGLVLLYGSLLVHVLFGLEVLYHRRTLRMPMFDATQLLMALALPPLMVLHLLGTRGGFTVVGLETGYDLVLTFYWKWVPINGLRQVGVVLVAWIHGCMGLYYWLRLRSAWPRWSGWVYPFALIVPVAALLGFVEAGKEVLALAADPEWSAGISERAAVMSQPEAAGLLAFQGKFMLGYFALLAAVLFARAIRLHRSTGEGFVVVRHVDGPTVEVRAGLSMLEMSRAAHVPHASLCGGRGRCGTCRVRVVDGARHLPAPSTLELETLARIDAGEGVRLACQCIPERGPLTLERLVEPDAVAEELHVHGGVEPS